MTGKKKEILTIQQIRQLENSRKHSTHIPDFELIYINNNYKQKNKNYGIN